MPQPLVDLWNRILDVLQLIIVPDWSDPIHWLPLLFSALVGATLAFIALRWWSERAVNRTRLPRRLAVAPPPPGVHMPGPSPWPFFLPIGLAVVLFGLVLHPAGEVANPPVVGFGLAVTVLVIGGWVRDAMRDWRRVEAVAAGVGHGESMHPLEPAVAALPSGSWVQPRVAPGLAAGPDHLAAAHHGPAGVHAPAPSPWPFFAPIGAFFVLFGLVMSPAIMLGGLIMGLIAIGGWFRDAGREFRQVDAGLAPEPVTRDPERAFPKVLVGVFALVAVASVGVAAAPAAIGYLNASPAPAQAGAPAAGGPPPSDHLQVTAQDVRFVENTLTAPAGQPFTIVFQNKDAVPHNIAIFDSSAMGTLFFRGQIFAGPATKTYAVPALKAGTYYFHCDVHPTAMYGTLIVK